MIAPINRNSEIQGYAFMLGSVLIFALLPYYLQFLTPVDGNVLFAYRVLTQLFFGLLFMAVSRQLHEIRAVFSNPKILALICLTSPLIAAQWWVFFWGPVNGETINIAMGYFLLPITMSLTGRFFLKERMNPLLWLAVGAAMFGVMFELFRSHSFSWVTLLICLGYPPYFILRRKIQISTKSNFVAENFLLTPIALLMMYFAIHQGLEISPSHNWGPLLIFGSGLLGTIAMLFFVSASKRLSFTVFGMLNYAEPILIMLVAIFLLGETINQSQLWSYSCFAVAVLLVIGDSFQRLSEK